MPWTEKQLRLFRAAAHNSAFAKRSGIKQEEAARMMKEGVKRVRSTPTKAKILKQNTGHGRVDMPFSQLNRFAGMKAGGVMKKRRFDEGGDVDSDIEYTTDEDGNEIAISRKSYAGGVRLSPTMEKAKSKSASKPAAKAVKPVVKEREVKPSLPPRDIARGASTPFRNYLSRRQSVEGMKAGGAVMRSRKDVERDQMAMAPYRKGGEVKDSKAMMRKEVSFMKKKGAPASMVKHEEAEMKGMRKGGKCYASGGAIRSHGEHGVQKSGHTKGTVIKMAKGGFVRSADGCAQRGKTKGKVM